MISSFVQGGSWGSEMLPLGRGHGAGGQASIRAQVFLTSHFLSREQYKMLPGSRCQMSRTDSYSAGEWEGLGGWRPSRRRALGWAEKEAAALSLSWLRNPGPQLVSRHIQFDLGHLWAPHSWPGRETGISHGPLPVPGAFRNSACSGAAGSCSLEIVWAVSWGRAPPGASGLAPPSPGSLRILTLRGPHKTL